MLSEDSLSALDTKSVLVVESEVSKMIVSVLSSAISWIMPELHGSGLSMPELLTCVVFGA